RTDAPLVGDRVGQDRLELRAPPLPLCRQRIDVDSQPMIVVSPHSEDRQYGCVYLELPAISRPDAGIEADRDAIPSFGLGLDKHAGGQKREADIGVGSKLYEAERVVALIKIAISDVCAHLAARPGNQPVPNVQAAIERATIVLA